MENNSIEKSPKNAKLIRLELLGDIAITKFEKSPLGGLNPYNQHFDIIGQKFLQLLINYAGLKPHHNILDIGCGTGRLAKQLENFLDAQTYHGLDVNHKYIDYCNNAYKKLNFHHIDIQHDEYNKHGKIIEQQLPYSDKSFDMVIAIALFNHLKYLTIYDYITQISRILKPNGIFFCTAILINERSKMIMIRKESPPFQFRYQTQYEWHDHIDRPLLNVAIPEDLFRRAMIKNRLSIKEPIRYGEWCNNQAAITGHDVIIAKKH